MTTLHQERERFQEEITATNLSRLWWLTLIATAISVGTFLFNLFKARKAEMIPLGVVDLLLSGVMIALIWYARRPGPPARWHRALVIVYALLMLAVMDAYFFSSMPLVGHNASYVIGVMACGVFILLRPGVFWPLLLANHAVYCALLLSSGREAILAAPAIIDGSTGMVFAGLAASFLYSARWSNFCKEKLIAQRNRELAATNAELKQRNEEMNELMAIAAHDLRSPLEGQKNLLHLAASRLAPGGERIGGMIQAAVDSCGGMLALVSRLLEAHRVEHGATHLHLEERDLRPHFTAAIERMRSTAEAKGIRIEASLPAESAIAVCEPASLDQALDNLLSNAVKFSPGDSRVGVVLRPGEGCWIGEIQDEGPGVPANERGDLFKKFHRGSARPTAGEGSAGLGLFIVKTLTESMGGKIGYAPRRGGGSMFVVELPGVRQE